MNKYKNDNEKLEKRQKIVKKEISSTLAKKETIKAKKNIFKKSIYFGLFFGSFFGAVVT